jgi:hypothetical protein
MWQMDAKKTCVHHDILVPLFNKSWRLYFLKKISTMVVLAENGLSVCVCVTQQVPRNLN